MAEYYYTVASLPMLVFNQAPQITVEYFLETCRYTLSEKDYETLISSVDTEGGEKHPAVKQWLLFEKSLRNELVKMRASKLGKDADKYMRPGDSTTGVYDAAREAFGASNPKAGEEILNEARWRYLDEIENTHNFDLTKLIVYYLKLKIAERKEVMSDKNGEEKYKEIYNGIAEKIHQSYDGDNNGSK
ncbi:MAG: DUF2764 family protein [Spirochaetales bacterium]|nr:DUF2764 family protein [Spirochaetales bacterium]